MPSTDELQIRLWETQVKLSVFDSITMEMARRLSSARLEEGRLVPWQPGAGSLGHADGARRDRRQQRAGQPGQQRVGQRRGEVAQHAAHRPHRRVVHHLAGRALHELRAGPDCLKVCLIMQLLAYHACTDKIDE